MVYFKENYNLILQGFWGVGGSPTFSRRVQLFQGGSNFFQGGGGGGGGPNANSGNPKNCDFPGGGCGPSIPPLWIRACGH